MVACTAAEVGLRCTSARTASEGMTLLRARRPRAVVLDLGLPGRDGFRILEDLAGDESLKHIPILTISSRAITVPEHEAIVRAGCAYLTKGECSPGQIAASLREALAA